MRLLTAIAMLGLVAAVAAAEDEPTKSGKATVQLTGQFTADKDSTLNYTLKKGGKVIAEEKGLSALPSKGIEVDAANAAGPFELTVSGTGGVIRVTQIGITVTASGKTAKGTFGGRPFALNAPEGMGILRGITFPITPVKDEEPKKKPDETKKTVDEPKKKVDETKKKSDGSALPVAPAPRSK